MCPMSYAEAWSYLDRLQFFKIKLGLESMTELLAELASPQLAYPAIHIGGTNGKGSVGATLLAVLSEAGYRTGLYTSPHLSSVRERFRIGGEFISEAEFAATAEQIVTVLAGRQITYFEFTTALALLWFRRRQVDLAILEVGMGGRLDATNVVKPLVSVITNVSMDHEQYLGNRLDRIAFEKAGIIKAGVPAVSGALHPEALPVIRHRANQLGSPLHLLQRDFSGRPHRAEKNRWDYTGLGTDEAPPLQLLDLPLTLPGRHQADNAALALAVLEIIRPRLPVSAAQIRRGLSRVAWPGRLEEFQHADRRFLLDGAHNPDGARVLRAALADDFSYTRLILIWAAMADKDVSATLLQVAPLAAEIIFTRPESERSARPEALRGILPDELRRNMNIACAESVAGALDLALERAQPGDLICVAGSLYLVGQARQILCGELVDRP